MLISLCTPVMNRTADLKRVMPYRIEAAVESLPVEFVVLDYNSQDDLEAYATGELKTKCHEAGILLTYRKYIGRNHYHQAHAYNLAVLSGHGEYVCVMGADTHPVLGYFPLVRELIANGCHWVEEQRFKGAICVNRSDFDTIGGYDERFEFYGSEDRDIALRLQRLGVQKGILPKGWIGNVPTPDEVKMANYRIQLTKKESSTLMRGIFDENTRNDVIVVNKEGWGGWN